MSRARLASAREQRKAPAWCGDHRGHGQHKEGSASNARFYRIEAAPVRGRSDLMGYQNANNVAMNWRRLDGAPFKILTRMALTILDDKPGEPKKEKRWWGGVDILGYALGRDDPPDADQSPEAIAYRKQTAQSVKRGIAALIKAGALTRVVRPGLGRRAEYVCNFEPVGLSQAPNAGLSGDCNAGLSQDETGASQGPTKEDLMRTEEHMEEPTSPEVPVSPAPVDKSAPVIDLFSARPPAKPAPAPKPRAKPWGPNQPSGHGCIRGWLPAPDGTRSTNRCHCNPERN